MGAASIGRAMGSIWSASKRALITGGVFLVFFLPAAVLGLLGLLTDRFGVLGWVAIVLGTAGCARFALRWEANETEREKKQEAISAQMWGWLWLIAGFSVASLISDDVAGDDLAFIGRVVAVVMGFALYGFVVAPDAFRRRQW